MKKEKKFKIYKFIYIILFIIILGVVIIEFNKYSSYKEKEKLKQEKIKELTNIKNSYSTYVKAKNGSYIYFKEDKEYKKNCLIHGEIELTLDDNYRIEDEYYKILNTNYYVKYNDIVPSSELSNKVGEYLYYKNYIPYNESIVLKDNAKLYVNNENYYELMVGDIFEIIIKEDDKYGIEYNNSLVYVNKNDVLKNIKNDLSEKEYAEDIAVLNYHYVVSSTNEGGELVECKSEICITDIKFDSHIKYLADNNYYGVSMRDLELFIEDKIRLPKNSVSITIDDGWYVSRAITILEKYKINATLFLIGSLASPNDYKSNYLEVHSHSWDMHKLGVCPSTVGRGGILCLDDKTILEDLKKSRESLNNTTYFCYPFYDYNERAIKLLKEAGFTMAFAGQINNSKVKVGQNKFKIPRFVIVNYTSMDNFINYIS